MRKRLNKVAPVFTELPRSCLTRREIVRLLLIMFLTLLLPLDAVCVV